MKQSSLSNWLKSIIIGAALWGFVLYLFIFPNWGGNIAAANPELAFCYWPWLCLFWVTAVPCYIALVLCWRIAREIGKDKEISEKNALDLKRISNLAIIDSAVFFLGNVVFLFLRMNHPGVILLSLIVIFIGIAIAVVSAVLSQLVRKQVALEAQAALDAIRG